MDKKYYCKICGKKLKAYYSVGAHIKNVHTIHEHLLLPGEPVSLS